MEYIQQVIEFNILMNLEQIIQKKFVFNSRVEQFMIKLFPKKKIYDQIIPQNRTSYTRTLFSWEG